MSSSRRANEFETAKAHSYALDTFRRLPVVSKWLVEVKGGEYRIENGTLICTKTKRTYSSGLFRYWTAYLSKKYGSLNEWIQSVKTARKSDDQTVRKEWAYQLAEFMNNNGFATGTKELFASSVKSFLRAMVDEEIDFDFKLSYTTEELQDKMDEVPMSVEQMRKIYESCKTARDKALILVAVNTVAPEEMVQFTERWRDWLPKKRNGEFDRDALKAPFRVKLIRVKKGVPYHVTLFEDAVEALRALYEEREEKIAKGEELFVQDDNAKPFVKRTYESLWENIRERTGLTQRQPNGRFVVPFC